MNRIRNTSLALVLICLAGQFAAAQPPGEAWRLPPIDGTPYFPPGGAANPYPYPPAGSSPSDVAFPLPDARLHAEGSAETVLSEDPLAEPELGLEEEPGLEEIGPGEPIPWYYPTQWIRSPEWDRGIEIGINGTAGNAESLSMKAGGHLKRATDENIASMDLTYAKTVADSRETQHYSIFNAKYEKLFGESPWTVFTKFYGEYDEFKAFDVRLALNGGLGYKLVDDDITTMTTRFGAGVSHEIGGPDDSYVPEALFGMDYERALTQRQKMTASIDYFPDWTNFEDYRLVTDFGWKLLVDAEANLSIKLAINNRFDSTPNGREPNDINYSLLLLWDL